MEAAGTRDPTEPWGNIDALKLSEEMKWKWSSKFIYRTWIIVPTAIDPRFPSWILPQWNDAIICFYISVLQTAKYALQHCGKDALGEGVLFPSPGSSSNWQGSRMLENQRRSYFWSRAPSAIMLVVGKHPNLLTLNRDRYRVRMCDCNYLFHPSVCKIMYQMCAVDQYASIVRCKTAYCLDWLLARRRRVWLNWRNWFS